MKTVLEGQPLSRDDYQLWSKVFLFYPVPHSFVSRSMPLTLIASLIDPTTGEPVPPSAQRETFFETTSGLPFMYSFTTSTSDTVSLPCPCCNTINRGVKWITPEGNTAGEGAGFAEPNFVHQCEWCSEKFTRTVMGIRKFAEEVTRKRAMRKVYFP